MLDQLLHLRTHDVVDLEVGEELVEGLLVGMLDHADEVIADVLEVVEGKFEVIHNAMRIGSPRSNRKPFQATFFFCLLMKSLPLGLSL